METPSTPAAAGTPSPAVAAPKGRSPLFWMFVFVAMGCFGALAAVHHPDAGWNVNTRLNLIWAVVYEGTFAIDSWHDVAPHATGDKAVYEGHFYSDKIWGVSLLGLPAAYLMEFWPAPLPFQFRHYMVRLSAVGLPSVASVLLFLGILVRVGTPPRLAVLYTGVVFFGTMWYGYSTVFYPYAPGLATALGALHLTMFPPSRRVTPLLALSVGLLLGFSLLCDMIFVIVVAGVGSVFLLRLGDQAGWTGIRAFSDMAGLRSNLKQTAVLATLSLIGLLFFPSLFAAYCYSIFGTFGLPYSYSYDETFRLGMAEGIMGVERPRIGAFVQITIMPYRGILVYSPVFMLAFAGLVIAAMGTGKRRVLGFLGLWMALAYLLFNSAYYMWWGGWSMGPRFLIPAIPFVALGLMELDNSRRRCFFDRFPEAYRPMQGLFAFFAVCSLALTLPLSITEPQTAQGNDQGKLMTPSWNTRYEVPQVVYLKEFYRGNVSAWLSDRMVGQMKADSPTEGYLSNGFVVLLALAGFLAAWFASPAKSPFTRVDHPFRTVDGTAAPPPPIP